MLEKNMNDELFRNFRQKSWSIKESTFCQKIKLVTILQTSLEYTRFRSSSVATMIVRSAFSVMKGIPAFSVLEVLPVFSVLEFIPSFTFHLKLVWLQQTFSSGEILWALQASSPERKRSPVHSYRQADIMFVLGLLTCWVRVSYPLVSGSRWRFCDLLKIYPIYYEELMSYWPSCRVTHIEPYIQESNCRGIGCTMKVPWPS